MNLVFCSFPFCLGYGSFISWNAATTCLHTATYWTKFNPHQPLITMTLTYVLFNPIILIRHALCSVRIYSNRTTWYALSVSSFKFSVYLSMPSMKMSHGLWPAWVKGVHVFGSWNTKPWTARSCRAKSLSKSSSWSGQDVLHCPMLPNSCRNRMDNWAPK
jgi:hypothetical protein